jgi:hypothetical protein
VIDRVSAGLAFFLGYSAFWRGIDKQSSGTARQSTMPSAGNKLVDFDPVFIA